MYIVKTLNLLRFCRCRFENQLSGNLSTYWVAQATSDPPRIPGRRYQASKYIFARCVMQTVEKFLASADSVVSMCHLPNIAPQDLFTNPDAQFDGTFIIVSLSVIATSCIHTCICSYLVVRVLCRSTERVSLSRPKRTGEECRTLTIAKCG